MGEVGYKTLAIDIETFSDVDLIKCGVYAYADSPAFEILLFAYSFDDEETKIIDLAQGEQLTEEIKNALSDVGIIKTAFNANWESVYLPNRGFVLQYSRLCLPFRFLWRVLGRFWGFLSKS